MSTPPAEADTIRVVTSDAEYEYDGTAWVVNETTGYLIILDGTGKIGEIAPGWEAVYFSSREVGDGGAGPGAAPG